MFHTEILSEEQNQLLPLVKLFRKEYYLVGGTALALYFGHRKSIDFDLFTNKTINHLRLKKILSENSPAPLVYSYEADDQLHLRINSVKLTFFQFPFEVPHETDFNEVIKMPSLLDLAAMKAFAFAQRAKWKDYVDMYFILKNNFALQQICKRTEELFNKKERVVFTEKLFRQQLCFFEGIDFSEQVEFVGQSVSEEEVKKFLIQISAAPF